MGSDAFRAGMRKLAGGVTIITTVDEEGRRTGLTATAVCSLSVDPPSLIACVNRTSSVAAVVRQAKVFAVNVLSPEQQDVAEVFAGRTGLSREDRFTSGHWSVEQSGAPVLRNACVSFECELADVHEYGTHLILIGKVIATHSEKVGDLPLLYANGSFLSAATRPFAA